MAIGIVYIPLGTACACCTSFLTSNMDAQTSPLSLPAPRKPNPALKRRKWGIFDIAYEEPPRSSIFHPWCSSKELQQGVSTVWRMFSLLFHLTAMSSVRYFISHVWQACSPAISLLLAHLSLNLVSISPDSMTARSIRSRSRKSFRAPKGPRWTPTPNSIC